MFPPVSHLRHLDIGSFELATNQIYCSGVSGSGLHDDLCWAAISDWRADGRQSPRSFHTNPEYRDWLRGYSNRVFFESTLGANPPQPDCLMLGLLRPMARSGDSIGRHFVFGTPSRPFSFSASSFPPPRRRSGADRDLVEVDFFWPALGRDVVKDGYLG